MWLCKRDLSKECDGKYKDCTDCVLDKIRAEIENTENELGCKTSEDVAMKTAYIQVLKIIDKYKVERSNNK